MVSTILLTRYDGLISITDCTFCYKYVYKKDSFFENFTADTFVTYKYFAGINSMSPNLTDADRKHMGFDLKDVLISCTFDLNPCNVSDFEWYYDTFYG